MSEIIKTEEELTAEDWREYHWIFDDIHKYYIRSYRKTYPPNDGYNYIDITSLSDVEQIWIRGSKKEE